MEPGGYQLLFKGPAEQKDTPKRTEEDMVKENQMWQIWIEK